MAFPTGWSNKHKITINTTALSLGGSLTNEPVLLRDNQFLAAAYSNSQGKQLSSNYLSSDANLQGYWKLESDGTDTSSNSYTLSGVNTPTHTTGMFGNGTDLEQGSTQAYTIADASCANLEISGSQTWSAWIKPESTPAGFMHIMGKNDGAGGAIHRLCIDSSDFPFFELDGLTTNDKATSTIPVVAGNWYHICGVYNSSESLIKIYVNGHLTTATASGSSTDTNGDFAIGRLGADTTSSNYFDGIIDDCAVFDRALNNSEVLAIYTGGADLRFTTDEAGTAALDHEVVDWDIDNSTAQVWVKIPTISTTTTDIYVHYNNSTAVPYGRELSTLNSLKSDANLQGYWKLESDGTDETSNNNDLTGNGTPTHATGFFGNGVDLEETSSQYYSIADGSQTGLDITGDITISAWIKLEQLPSTASQSFGIACKTDVNTTANRAYELSINSSDELVFFYGDGGGTNTTRFEVNWTFKSTDLGKWFHVAAAVDVSAKTALMYVNGKSEAYTKIEGGTGATSIVNNSEAFEIGRRNNSGSQIDYFDGIIDDVAVFNRQLSASELESIYGTGRSVWSNGYQGVWHLQDGNGRDSSINQYDLNAGTFPATPITTGKWGNAMDFERDNSEYLTIAEANMANLDSPSTFTLHAWFNAETASAGVNMGLLGQYDSGLTEGYYLRFAQANQYMATGYNDGTLSDIERQYEASAISTSTWYHLVGSFTGTAHNIYLNNSKESDTGITGSLNGVAGDFSIGRRGSYNGNYWDGKVQEIWMVNAAKSDDWVDFQYNTQNSPDTYITASAVSAGFPKAIIY